MNKATYVYIPPANKGYVFRVSEIFFFPMKISDFDHSVPALGLEGGGETI